MKNKIKNNLKTSLRSTRSSQKLDDFTMKDVSSFTTTLKKKKMRSLSPNDSINKLSISRIKKKPPLATIHQPQKNPPLATIHQPQNKSSVSIKPDENFKVNTKSYPKKKNLIINDDDEIFISPKNKIKSSILSVDDAHMENVDAEGHESDIIKQILNLMEQIDDLTVVEKLIKKIKIRRLGGEIKKTEIEKHYSEKAILCYEGVSREDIVNNPNFSQVKILNDVNGRVEASVKFDTRKRWNPRSEILKTQGVLPIKAGVSNPKLEYDWLEIKDAPVKGTSVNGSYVDDWAAVFIFSVDKTAAVIPEIDNFCFSLLHDIKNGNFIWPNEDCLSMILAVKIMQTMQPSFIAVNKKITESICGKDLTCKPDLFFCFQETIYVFELKYRPDRNEEDLNALNCLDYKQYPARIINFIRKNNSSLLNSVIRVIEVGLAMEDDPEAKITVSARHLLLKDIDLDRYKTANFYTAMKRNKKRFKTAINRFIKKKKELSIGLDVEINEAREEKKDEEEKEKENEKKNGGQNEEGNEEKDVDQNKKENEEGNEKKGGEEENEEEQNEKETSK